MEKYIKKYTQGFVLAIMFPIFNALWELSWNDGVWKHWIALALTLPAVLYFLSEFSKEFTKFRFFSKVSFFMYVFSGLGIISAIVAGFLVGWFH